MYSINYYNLLSLKSRASLVTATVRVPPTCATHSGSHNLLTLATVAILLSATKKQISLAFQLVLVYFKLATVYFVLLVIYLKCLFVSFNI